MEYTCYKLAFNAPLHLAEEGLELEEASSILHSDTLVGAIVNVWSLLYPEDSIERLLKEASFTVTSAFPYTKDVLFFPRPRLPIRLPAHVSLQKRKKLKKIRFLSLSLFQRVILGEEIPDIHVKGVFGSDQKAPEIPFQKTEIPRVTLDRISSASEIFYFHQLHFSPNSGLWFAVLFKDQKTQEKFEASLNLLGDHGIGADRSTGKGFFVPKKSSFELSLPSNTTHTLTLSLLHPSPEEFARAERYQIIERRGWVTSPHGGRSLRQKMVRMLSEGSIFRGEVYGKVPKVLNQLPARGLNHPVYRWGKAFTVPCILVEEEND